MHAVVVPLQERSERVAITGACSGDETRIWIAADLCHPNARDAPQKLAERLWTMLVQGTSGLMWAASQPLTETPSFAQS